MEKIIKKIGKILDSEKAKALKEIEEFKEKQRSSIDAYGFGGAYYRQEKAIEKREERLNKINEFERQLNSAVDLVDFNVYANQCDRCGAIWVTNKEPFDDWHECPSCRGMVKCRNAEKVHLRIANDGQGAVAMIKDALKKQEEDNRIWND